MTLLDLLIEKGELVRKADDVFLESVQKIEKSILKKVIKILRGLAQKEGKLLKDQIDNNLPGRIKRQILKIIRESGLAEQVKKFTRNLDVTEDLNRKIYKIILNEDLELELNPYKQIFVDEITDALTARSSLVKEFVNPIRKTLIGSIAANMSVEQTEELLTNFITGIPEGPDKRLGEIRRYTGQIARDMVGQYDGMVNDLTRDAYQLDAFQYVGVNVMESRKFCRHLLDAPNNAEVPKEGGFEPNMFADLAIGPGQFLVKDIEKIFEIAGDWKGKNDLVTVETFAQYRGGHNCIDQVIYFRASDSQRIARQTKQ